MGSGPIYRYGFPLITLCALANSAFPGDGPPCLSMKRGQKWAVGLGIAAAVLGAAWLAVAWQLPDEEDLAARLASEAEQRLGVKVTIGSAHLELLPRPVVVVNDFRTQQAEPVTIGRLTARLKARSVLDRKLLLDRISIQDAVL